MNYKSDYIEFSIRSGDVLSVNRNNNLLNMNFPAYEPKIVDQNLDELYDAFGVRPEFFFYYKYGLAVFKNEEEIIKVLPNLNIIEKLSYDGIIVTAPGENVDFVSRFFAPKFGIPEDPVTGGAYCELIPYWSKRLNKKEMIAKQLSKRGGVIHCSYLGDRVIIGGEATTYMQGELMLGAKG
jgi:predicted PhzF superfamily epimerase YddE/YHI9